MYSSGEDRIGRNQSRLKYDTVDESIWFKKN